MKISISYIFLLVLLVVFSTYSIYNIKKYIIHNKWFYMFLAIISSFVVIFLFYKCYKQPGIKISITNHIWLVAVSINLLIIGRIAFHKIITKYEIIGIMFNLIGLYFILID